MTTARKTMLILATVLLVSGLGIAAWAFGAAGFSFENLSTTARDWTQTTRTFEPETDAPHTSITVRDTSENVRFEATSADAIEVLYWTSSDKSMNVSEEGGALVIEGAEKPYRGVMLMADFQDRTTVVKVPLSYTGSISIETASGNIDLVEFVGLTSVVAATSSGDINATNLAADEISLHATSGNISMSSTEANYLETLTTSGNVTIADAKATQDVNAGTSSGNALLSRINAAALTVRSTSGDVDATSLDVDDIVLEASSGNVDATVVGSEADYEVSAFTSSGTLNVPHGATRADKHVALRTTSGDINLAFHAGSSIDGSSGQDTLRAPEAPEAPKPPKTP